MSYPKQYPQNLNDFVIMILIIHIKGYNNIIREDNQRSNIWILFESIKKESSLTKLIIFVSAISYKYTANG